MHAFSPQSILVEIERGNEKVDYMLFNYDAKLSIIWISLSCSFLWAGAGAGECITFNFP